MPDTSAPAGGAGPSEASEQGTPDPSARQSPDAAANPSVDPHAGAAGVGSEAEAPASAGAAPAAADAGSADSSRPFSPPATRRGLSGGAAGSALEPPSSNAPMTALPPHMQSNPPAATITPQTGEDCGTCAACLDKPKFGGPGIKRKGCLMKRTSKDGLRPPAAALLESGVRAPSFTPLEQTRRFSAASAGGSKLANPAFSGVGAGGSAVPHTSSSLNPAKHAASSSAGAEPAAEAAEAGEEPRRQLRRGRSAAAGEAEEGGAEAEAAAAAEPAQSGSSSADAAAKPEAAAAAAVAAAKPAAEAAPPDELPASAQKKGGMPHTPQLKTPEMEALAADGALGMSPLSQFASLLDMTPRLPEQGGAGSMSPLWQLASLMEKTPRLPGGTGPSPSA